VLSERLVEADRIKDEFLATVGHELRTPLNAIVGWLHVLRQSQLSPERTSRAIDTIERNANAQARLVDDRLDVSRIISGKMTFDVQPLSAGTVVERAIEAMRLRSRPSDRGGRIPAVALTAHARVEDRARALYAGFNNHVPKPIDPIELFAVIAALARKLSTAEV
jgi:signal transduction histidine kinase